jgi:RNA polymerase sigma-70 factor (ECF subfamily)
MADQHLTQDVIGTVDLEADRFKPGLTGVSEPALHDMCSPAEGRQIPVTEVDGGLRCTVGVSPASACHRIPSTGSTPGGSMGRCGVLLQAKGLPVVLSIAEALPDEPLVAATAMAPAAMTVTATPFCGLSELTGVFGFVVTRMAGRRDPRGVRVSDVAEAYRKNGDALIRFAASQVGPDHAEDVVSAAVLGVLQNPGLEVEELRSYLFRCVANASARYWRTLGRRARREALFGRDRRAGIETPDPVPEVTAALAALSPQQRAVVHLAYWEDLTPAAIARHLDVSEGSVRRQLARARHKLATALDDHRGGST